MEAHLEALVMSFLTRFGSVFVSPQYDIAWDKEAAQGGACPDFVALDFGRKHVVVVEVTSGYALKGLFEKIDNRHQHWFPPLVRRLERIGAITSEWKPRFLGILREARLEVATNEFADSEDVSFYALEKALLEYAYWDDRKDGLP